MPAAAVILHLKEADGMHNAKPSLEMLWSVAALDQSIMTCQHDLAGMACPLNIILKESIDMYRPIIA